MPGIIRGDQVGRKVKFGKKDLKKIRKNAKKISKKVPKFGVDITKQLKKLSKKTSPGKVKKLSKNLEQQNMGLHCLSELTNKKSGLVGMPLPRATFERSKNHHDAKHKVMGGFHEAMPVPAEPAKRSKMGREAASRVKQDKSKKDSKLVALLQRGSFNSVPYSVGGFIVPGKN